MGLVGWDGVCGMEENKKSGSGDVRAKALSWDIEWEKAKNVFFGFLPLAPTVARCARHSHPSPPEKKAASRRKSRLRRKKTAPVGVAWVGALRGGRKILRPYKWEDRGYSSYSGYRDSGCGGAGVLWVGWVWIWGWGMDLLKLNNMLIFVE